MNKKHKIKQNYKIGYSYLLENYCLSICQVYPVLFRKIKVGTEDIVEDLLSMVINHNTTEKELKCFKVMLCNLVWGCKKGFDGVFHSSDKTHYRSIYRINGTPHKSYLYYNGAQRFIQKMSELGFIVKINGKKDFHMGYMLFTEKFKKEVKDNTMSIIKPVRDVVKLKKYFTRDTISYVQTPEITKLKDFIEKYNDFMDGYSVHLNGKPVPSDIYRLYIDDFSQYGRFHGLYQIIRKEDRPDITFDYSPTSEIDIESCHLTIVYAQEGVDLSKTNRDLYDPQSINDRIVSELKQHSEGCVLTRKDIKAFILCMLNCKSKLQTVQALVNMDQLSTKFGRQHAFYNTVIDYLLQEHKVINNYFFKGLSMELMYDESEMMLEILKRCVDKSLPVLPIHDSIICLRDNTQQVSNIMRDVFLQRWGVNCTVKIK